MIIVPFLCYSYICWTHCYNCRFCSRICGSMYSYPALVKSRLYLTRYFNWRNSCLFRYQPPETKYSYLCFTAVLADVIHLALTYGYFQLENSWTVVIFGAIDRTHLSQTHTPLNYSKWYSPQIHIINPFNQCIAILISPLEMMNALNV